MSVQRYRCQNPDDIYTDSGIKELWDKHKILHEGVFGIQIIPRENYNPIIKLGMEDDGTIFFHDKSPEFDSYWLDSLIKLLEMTKEKIASIPGEDEFVVSVD